MKIAHANILVGGGPAPARSGAVGSLVAMSGDENSHEYLQVGDDGNDDDDDASFQAVLHDLPSHECVAEGRVVPCDGEVRAIIHPHGIPFVQSFACDCTCAHAVLTVFMWIAAERGPNHGHLSFGQFAVVGQAAADRCEAGTPAVVS